MTAATRLAGHALRLYGNPFESDGTPASIYSRIGHARCECGAMSGVLTTQGDRREWHREHKQQIRMGGAS